MNCYFLNKQQLEKERREKKKLKEKERIQRKKIEGTYLTKAQREERERAMKQLQALGMSNLNLIFTKWKGNLFIF